ncbi:hypothetical protein ACXIHB_10295 [Tenacibaculum sp. IMCC1]|nr:hypothetical protein KUL118_15650 [Tenacibaculum sp. KUL118]
MRINLCITVVFLLTITSNAQSRKNQERLTFVKNSEKIVEAKGWCLSYKTNQWVENRNAIDYQKVESFWVSHLSQNFKWIQFSKLNYNQKEYYVFIYEKLSGEYKYPYIKKDWIKENQTHVFILGKNQYLNLKNRISKQDGVTYEIRTKLKGFITDKYNSLGGNYSYNTENILFKIQNLLQNTTYKDYCLSYNSQVIDGKPVVRFKLPTECGYSKEKLDKEYFEISLELFDKILL